MTLLNRAISALYGGVSQQPAAIRGVNQCEAMDNCYATVAEGVRKRPPTKHIKKLTTSTPVNAKIHQVFRSGTERYTVGVWQNTVKVWDGDGIEKTVDTTTYANVLNYLDSADSISDVSMLTVADTTFIVNKKKVTAMGAATISAQTPYLFIYITQGRAESTYSVVITGVGTASVTTTTAAANYASTTVATNLAAALNALGGGTTLVATVSGNLVVVRRANNAAFTFTHYDTQGNTLMTAFMNRVERYSDLPRTFVADITVEVRGQGDLAGAKSAFWVKFVPEGGGSSNGHWEETVAPNVGESQTFDATTMPVALVRLGDGTFRLERISWASRLVGSTASTVPPPSFIGYTISGIFFWRGRLGFLSEEGVILSRSANLFNFWPKSSNVVNDDDPIDVTVNSPKVSVLRHAVPFQKNLLLFSDSAQFQLTGGDTLSPRTARCDVASEYDCSSKVVPVSSGRDIFFAFERADVSGAYAGIREYAVDANSVTNSAVEVTAHVPQYIPRNVHRLSVSSTEDVLLALTKDEWYRVYVYKYLWDGDERVQSSVFRWSFRPSDKVLSAEVNGSTVHLVIQRTDGIHLETMNLQYADYDAGIGPTGGAPSDMLLVHLDRRTELTGVYNAGTFTTTFTLPYSVPEGTPEIVLGSAWGAARGKRLYPAVATSTTLTLSGDWSAHPVFVGLKYESRFRFSTIYMRDREGAAVVKGRLQLRYMTVSLRDSTYLRAEVATPGRDTASYVWLPMKLGALSFLTDTPLKGTTGVFSFPVASSSLNATIDLVNDSPYPSTFHAAEWEGVFANRSVRA